MGKGSKPSKPAPIEPTATEIAQARISAEKWNDFTQRYMPVEGVLRDRVNALDSDSSYNRAMAIAANNASTQLGGAAMAGARQMAGGGSPLAMLSAYTGANEMAARGMAGQYMNQRGNFLNQGKALMEMGSGISGQGMGAFKSVASYDTSEANRAYADKVGKNLADSSQRLATLNAVGNLAMSAGRSAGNLMSSPTSTTTMAESPWSSDFSTAFKYNTNPYSQQSHILAAQDRSFY